MISKRLSVGRLRWGGDLMGCGLRWRKRDGKSYNIVGRVSKLDCRDVNLDLQKMFLLLTFGDYPNACTTNAQSVKNL